MPAVNHDVGVALAQAPVTPSIARAVDHLTLGVLLGAEGDAGLATAG